MKEKQKNDLKDLSNELVTPERFRSVLSAADIALEDTIEFEPVRPTATILSFPHGLVYKDPERPELGFTNLPEPPEAA